MTPCPAGTHLSPGHADRDNFLYSFEEYTAASNGSPKPLVWTATTESMLAKVRRGRVALGQTINQ